jgi:hypothetical protein
MPKSQTIPDKTVTILTYSTFYDWLQESVTGFQLFELGALKSSMALNYKYFND